MFAEFEKYFWWDDKDASKISYNFRKRDRTRVNRLFYDARKKQQQQQKSLCPLKCRRKCCIIGKLMKTLRRRTSKESRPEHLSRVARYTLLELSSKLPCVIE